MAIDRVSKLGRNCGTCEHAEETDYHKIVVCTCAESYHFEKEMSVILWCRFYEEQ